MANFSPPPVPTLVKIEATLCTMNNCPSEFNSDGFLVKYTLIGIKVDKMDNWYFTVRRARRGLCLRY